MFSNRQLSGTGILKLQENVRVSCSHFTDIIETKDNQLASFIQGASMTKQ